MMRMRTVVLVMIGVLATLLLLSFLSSRAEESAPAQSVNPNQRSLPFVYTHRSENSDSDYDSVEPKLLVAENSVDYIAAYAAIQKSEGPTFDAKPLDPNYDPDFIYFFVLGGKGAEGMDVLVVEQTANDDVKKIQTTVWCRVLKNGRGYPETSRSPWCAVKVARKDVFYFVNIQTFEFILLGEVRTAFKVNAERP